MKTLSFFKSSILVFSLSFSSYGLNCSALFQRLTRQAQPQIAEVDLARKTETLKNITNAIKWLRGNSADRPANSVLANRFLEKLDLTLLEGGFSAAERKLDNLFRKVEISFYIVKRHEQALEALELLPNNAAQRRIHEALALSDLSPELIRELEDQYVRLGSSLEELKKYLGDVNSERLNLIAKNIYLYKRAEYHLRDLANGDKNCGEPCQRAVKWLRDKLGANSDEDMVTYARYFQGEAKPTINQLEALVHNIKNAPQFNLKQEKIALFQEIQLLVTHAIFQPGILNGLFRYAINFPGLHTTRAVLLFKMIYDAQARAIFLPPVMRVIKSPGNVEDKFLMLQNEINVPHGEEILIAFARAAKLNKEIADNWDAIVAYAKEKHSDPSSILGRERDPVMKRINSALRKAELRRPLTLISRTSNLNRITLAGLAVFGTGAAFGIDDYFFEEEEDEAEKEKKREEVIDRLEEVNADTQKKIDELAKRIEELEKKPEEITPEEKNLIDEYAEWLEKGGVLATRTKQEAGEMIQLAKEKGGFLINMFSGEEEKDSEIERNPSSKKEKGFFHWLKVRFNFIYEKISHQQSLDI